MRIFITGASGFIGSALTREAIAAGHKVLGMTRSAAGAEALAALGAEPFHGTIGDPAGIKTGAAQCDAVVHLAFNHDFSRFAQNCADDIAVIEALGAALAGSDRPLVITSGTAIAISPPGQPSLEDGPTITSAEFPRAASEETARKVAGSGVNTSIMRLPQVHDPRRQGLISPLVETARARGAFAYIGEGANRWPAAHVSDVALLYRLAVERAERGAIYHAVAEEGVAMRAIAETVAARIGLPAVSIAQEEAEPYFGWLAHLAGRDMPASGAATQAKLGWQPQGPTMLEDLARLEVDE